jgi:uncharacterized protein DUF2867
VEPTLIIALLSALFVATPYRNGFHAESRLDGQPARRELVCRTLFVRNRMDGGPPMRLPNSVHTSRPWRIHELTRDFRLEDVWELPGVGGPDAFPLLVQLIASGDPSQSSSVAVRTLFAIRWKIGELLGWDGPDAGLGSRVPTLRDRLPADLRDAPSGPDFDALPFTSLYLLEDEWAAEIAKRTMHGVMHIGRVSDETGGFRAHMAVYVKPNGLLGYAYMAAIRPFRHLIVYPPMLREMGGTGRRPVQ